MKFSKDKRLLAAYQQLHDDLSQVIEDPALGQALKDAIGYYHYTCIVDQLVYINGIAEGK